MHRPHPTFSRITPARALALAVALSAFVVAGAAVGDDATAPPTAAKRPVENRYFNEAIQDDYQWMENWDDPTVKTWVDAQNAYTRKALDAIPFRGAIRDRLDELTKSIAPEYSSLVYRGKKLFALKDQPPK